MKTGFIAQMHPVFSKVVPERLKVPHMTREELSGQGLVEYALIIALVTLVCAGVLLALGLSIPDLYQVPWAGNTD